MIATHIIPILDTKKKMLRLVLLNKMENLLMNILGKEFKGMKNLI